MREYNNKIIDDEEFGPDIFTLEQWSAIDRMFFDQGKGYWAKDGYESDDDVHSTPQEDATHVSWYNK